MFLIYVEERFVMATTYQFSLERLYFLTIIFLSTFIILKKKNQILNFLIFFLFPFGRLYFFMKDKEDASYLINQIAGR